MPSSHTNTHTMRWSSQKQMKLEWMSWAYWSPFAEPQSDENRCNFRRNDFQKYSFGELRWKGMGIKETRWIPKKKLFGDAISIIFLFHGTKKNCIFPLFSVLIIGHCLISYATYVAAHMRKCENFTSLLRHRSTWHWNENVNRFSPYTQYAQPCATRLLCRWSSCTAWSDWNESRTV